MGIPQYGPPRRRLLLYPGRRYPPGRRTERRKGQIKFSTAARFQSVSYDLAHFRLFCLQPPGPLGTPKTQLPAPKMPWGVSGSPRRSALFSLVFPRGDLFGSFFREPSREHFWCFVAHRRAAPPWMALADFDPTWVGSDIARSPAFEEPFAVARSLSKTADIMISG